MIEFIWLDIMAYLSYNSIWKWISIDWSLFFNFYGKDFNPTVPDFPSWDTFKAYSATSTFNLSWFQPWHEVWCFIWNVTTEWATGTLYVESSLQAYRNWSRTTMWDYDWRYNTDWTSIWAWYMYFGVDYDEIRDYATQYRVVTNRELWSYWENGVINTFNVSNLSINSTLHTSWYLWVEGTHLCYTDATYSRSSWYKHTIAYDSSFSWWSWTPWYIWIPDSSSDKAIHYIDANWVERRTYYSNAWYGGTSYAGSPWYIWVWYWGMEDWYGYLCFIDYSWQKRRLLNWPV